MKSHHRSLKPHHHSILYHWSFSKEFYLCSICSIHNTQIGSFYMRKNIHFTSSTTYSQLINAYYTMLTQSQSINFSNQCFILFQSPLHIQSLFLFVDRNHLYVNNVCRIDSRNRNHSYWSVYAGSISWIETTRTWSMHAWSISHDWKHSYVNDACKINFTQSKPLVCYSYTITFSCKHRKHFTCNNLTVLCSYLLLVYF